MTRYLNGEKIVQNGVRSLYLYDDGLKCSDEEMKLKPRGGPCTIHPDGRKDWFKGFQYEMDFVREQKAL